MNEPRRPSECSKCGERFKSDRLLQAEIRHTLVKEGAGAAEIDLNDRLEDYHGEHRDS